MFFPFNTMLAQMLILFFFTLLVLFLFTADLTMDHFSGLTDAMSAGSTFLESIAAFNSTTAADIEAADASSTYVQAVVYLYVLFGFLWTIASFNNIGWTTMSGSVSHWYFFREDATAKTKVPLIRSLGRVLRYHLGSIFFGSFIIATIQLIRILLMALDRYTKKQQKSNLALKLIIKCTQCCLWCLEKTIKFITNYCYIYVAMQGSGFCKACFQTFGLIVGNPAQLSINTFVRTILSWIQLLALPISSAWVCNTVLTVQGTAETIWPTVVVAISAYIIASVFTLVFACVLDTLFVCCCRDRAEYKAKYMPNRLRVVFGFGKKKKEKKEDEGGDEEEAAPEAEEKEDKK